MIWAAAFVLVAISLVIVLWPIWRPSGEVVLLDSNTANVAVLKQQLLELEQEYQDGNLTDDQYAHAKQDLEQAVAADLVDDSSSVKPLSINGRRWVSLVMVIVLPLASWVLYQRINTYRDVPATQARSAEQSVPGDTQQELPSISEMAETLAARLRQDPENLTGWKLLGKTYAVMQKFPEAVSAYEKAYQLGGNKDAEMLVDYAEVLASMNENQMKGRAEELVAQALEIYPGMPKGLWLAGFASFQREDYLAAVNHWEAVFNNPDVAPESREILTQYLDEARRFGGLGATTSDQTKAPVIEKTQVIVHVSLDPSLVGNVKHEDTVYVFARLSEGMPMPLAVRKIRVADLPTTVVLDESMAMMAGHSLAGKDKIIVGARVSKGGGPLPQPGDIQGLTEEVSLKEASEFIVTIDQVVN